MVTENTLPTPTQSPEAVPEQPDDRRLDTTFTPFLGIVLKAVQAQCDCEPCQLLKRVAISIGDQLTSGLTAPTAGPS